MKKIVFTVDRTGDRTAAAFILESREEMWDDPAFDGYEISAPRWLASGGMKAGDAQFQFRPIEGVCRPRA